MKHCFHCPASPSWRRRYQKVVLYSQREPYPQPVCKTDYVELSRKLLETLTDAISIDVQGGEEKEVR